MIFLKLIIFLQIFIKIYCDPIQLISTNNNNNNNNKQKNSHDVDALEEQQRQRNYDISQIKLSKLRMLLLGELLKQKENIITYSKLASATPFLNCTATSQILNVTTKTCPCTNYLCKTPLVVPTSSNNNNYINQRSTSHIQSTCHDFCCKKRKTIKSIATHKKDNHTICDRTENILSKLWIVSIVRRQTDDVVCTGSALSSRVILTTADCVEKLSTTDLVVKNSNKEEMTIAKTLRDDRYHLGFIFVVEQKWVPVCLQNVNSNRLYDCRLFTSDNHIITEIKISEIPSTAAACDIGYQQINFGDMNACIKLDSLRQIVSGAPLVCRTFDSYIGSTASYALKGIFYSWNLAQDKFENFYNSYTDLFQYRNWIQKHL